MIILIFIYRKIHNIQLFIERTLIACHNNMHVFTSLKILEEKKEKT